jgi:chloride channel 3/4/5
MSLKRKRSALVDLFRHGRGGERAPGAGATDEDAPPTNAGSGPASTTWRRKRLLDIGHEGQGSGLAAPAGEGSNAVTETSSLRRGRNDASYGTLASPGYSPTRSRFRPNASLRVTRRVRSLSDDAHLASGPVSGLTARMPRSPMANSIRERTSVYFNIPTERPIAAYDAPLLQDIKKLEHEVTGGEVPLSAQVNGLRVWYASFTSIDWLHDSIKDAVRRGRLQSHKHKSVRGRVRAAADRLVGWVIVTVVGVLTAIAAFAIVRTEMMFFDWKEGYCAGAWWKAHRFCCPRLEDAEDAGLGLWRSTNASTSWPNFSIMNLSQPLATAAEETCSAWRTWSEVFGETAEHRGSWVGLKADMAEYIAYALIAVRTQFLC